MTEKQRKTLSMTSNIVGIVLCVILVPILLVNIVLIAKSFISPNAVPDIFGYKPFIVQTPSMQKPANSEIPYDNHINAGDLIFVKAVNPDTLKIGDIITFRPDPKSTNTVTHRIIEFANTTNGIEFIVKGDNNNAQDTGTVKKESIEGIYVSRIPNLGKFAMFMQEPIGIILFITVPLALFFVVYMLKSKSKVKPQAAVVSDEQQKLLLEKEELEKQLKLMKEKEELQKQLDSMKAAESSTQEEKTPSKDDTSNK